MRSVTDLQPVQRLRQIRETGCRENCCETWPPACRLPATAVIDMHLLAGRKAQRLGLGGIRRAGFQREDFLGRAGARRRAGSGETAPVSRSGNRSGGAPQSPGPAPGKIMPALPQFPKRPAHGMAVDAETRWPAPPRSAACPRGIARLRRYRAQAPRDRHPDRCFVRPSVTENSLSQASSARVRYDLSSCIVMGHICRDDGEQIHRDRKRMDGADGPRPAGRIADNCCATGRAPGSRGCVRPNMAASWCAAAPGPPAGPSILAR